MIAIYVFSGTGNTYRVISSLTASLQEFDEVKIQKIEDGNEEITFDYDTLIIAYPIHGFNAPRNVIRFVKRMKKGNKPFYFIKSSGEPLSLNNSSSSRPIKILKRKGYLFLGEFHYVMPYNMLFKHSDEMATKMLEVASKMTKRDALLIKDDRSHYLNRTLGSSIASFICKIEHLGMRLNGNLYRIEEDKCIKCLKCVRSCPTGNISFKDGKFRFGSNCLGCARCSFNCPTNAIKIGLLNFMKVSGPYDFKADAKKAMVGRYCRKSYTRYFEENDF